MKLLDLSMRLCNTNEPDASSHPLPFYPKTWTTALAHYTLSAFTGLQNVVQNYNSPKIFYRENSAVADFFNGLRFENNECEFKLKDNVIYSNEITKKKQTGWQKEVFFVMKLGYALTGVPSEHVNILKKYAESGNLYSNLPVLYPTALYNELTSGHIENPLDVISEVLNVKFEPLTMDRLYVHSYTCGNGAFEVYLPAEDKVAVLPAALVDMLTTRDIFEIALRDNILCLHNKPLHEICGKYGVYWKGALNLYDAD